MDDALAMRFVERVGDFGRDFQRLLERERAFLEAGGARLALEAGHDENMRAVGFADIVDAADVGMVEGGDGARLALEPRAHVGVAGNLSGEDFDGDGAIEPRVPRFVDFAHPTCPDGTHDFVWAQALACGQCHRPVRDGLGVHIFSVALGPHPQRVLTLMLALGFTVLGLAWPQALIPPAPMALTTSYGPDRKSVV